MRFLQSIKRGSEYMELWPDEPVLTAIFQEMRYKKMMRFSRFFIPPVVAALLLWLYFNCGGLSGMYLIVTRPSTGSVTFYLALFTVILMIIILLQLPILGLMWFCLRSMQPLEPRQKIFYKRMMKLLDKEPIENPKMMDFVKCLNEGCTKLKDKEFLEWL